MDETIRIPGGAPTKCRVTGFVRGWFERAKIEAGDGSVSISAWRCVYCGSLFVGSPKERAGFAHDCEIPGDLEIVIRDMASEP